MLFRYLVNFQPTSEITVPVDFTEVDLLRKEADLPDQATYPLPQWPQATLSSGHLWASGGALQHEEALHVLKPGGCHYHAAHHNNQDRCPAGGHLQKLHQVVINTRCTPETYRCRSHLEVSLMVHLMDHIMKQGFTIRKTRVHHMSKRANENTVEHHWTFCRPARKVEDWWLCHSCSKWSHFHTVSIIIALKWQHIDIIMVLLKEKKKSWLVWL